MMTYSRLTLLFCSPVTGASPDSFGGVIGFPPTKLLYLVNQPIERSDLGVSFLCVFVFLIFSTVSDPKFWFLCLVNPASLISPLVKILSPAPCERGSREEAAFFTSLGRYNLWVLLTVPHHRPKGRLNMAAI